MLIFRKNCIIEIGRLFLLEIYKIVVVGDKGESFGLYGLKLRNEKLNL